MRRVGEFLSAVWQDWLAKMSGPISVPLAIASFLVSTPVYKALYAASAIVLSMVTAGRIWLTEHEKVERLQAQIEGKLPQLYLEIRDVIINPKPSVADCFVKVFVNNLVADAPTTLHDYEISLTISGKTYRQNTLQKATGYAVGHLEDDDDEYPAPWRTHIVVDARMEDLSEMISATNPLIRGSAKEGWLHFIVMRVPQWPSYQEPTGQVDQYFDENGNEHCDEILDTVLIAQNITSLSLSTVDAFRKLHTVTVEGKILSASARRVISLQVDGQK